MKGLMKQNAHLAGTMKTTIAACLCAGLLTGVSWSAAACTAQPLSGPPGSAATQTPELQRITAQPQSSVQPKPAKASDEPSAGITGQAGSTSEPGPQAAGKTRDVVMRTISYPAKMETLHTLPVELETQELCQPLSRDAFAAKVAQWKQQMQEQERPPNRIQFDSIQSGDEPNAKLTGMTVAKFVDGKEVWRYEDRDWADGFMARYVETDAGIYVYGNRNTVVWDSNGSGTSYYEGVALLLSHDGKLLWRKTEGKTTKPLSFETAAVDGGGITLFGYTAPTNDNEGLPQYRLTVWRYDAKGKLLWRQENPMGKAFVPQKALTLDGKYLLKLSYYGEEDNRFIAVSDNGQLMKELIYTIDGKTYAVEDMLAVGDKLYLSCMARKQPKKEFDDDVFALYDHESKHKDVCSDELIAMFREEYSAALLTCDTAGAVSKVQLVENARAGQLTQESDVLRQQLIRVDSAIYLHLSIARWELQSTAFSLWLDEEAGFVQIEETGLNIGW